MTSAETGAEDSASGPALSIILPSFCDERIVQTISSIRLFDDIDTVRIIVIDGGSSAELVARIEPLLGDRDVLVSEPDKGIFDGLNKGLDLVETPYVGWIGSDDLFTGAVTASEVVSQLEHHDLYVAPLYITRGMSVVRKTHAWPCARGLASWGLHNPHYSTFGRSRLLCSERFQIGDISADIDYFLRVFARKPRIAITDRVALLQAEGGFSTKGFGRSLRVNRSVFRTYARRGNFVSAVLSVCLKLGYKAAGVALYKVLRRQWPDDFPELHRRLNGLL